MNTYFFTISVFLFSQLALQGQQTVAEKLKQVESSKYIDIPDDIIEELIPLTETDSVTFISFSNCTGVLLDHAQLTKREVILDLNMTSFKQRYFILLIDKKAVIYMNN